MYSQAIDSEVRSQIFLSNTTNGFHFNALAERYQNFDVCNPETETERGLHRHYADGTGPDSAHAQLLHLERGAAIGKYAAVLVVRERGRGFATAPGPEIRSLGSAPAPLVGRFDLAPSLAMPLQWQGWSFRPALTLRDTLYTQQFNPGLTSYGTAQTTF